MGARDECLFNVPATLMSLLALGHLWPVVNFKILQCDWSILSLIMVNFNHVFIQTVPGNFTVAVDCS